MNLRKPFLPLFVILALIALYVGWRQAGVEHGIEPAPSESPVLEAPQDNATVSPQPADARPLPNPDLEFSNSKIPLESTGTRVCC